MDSLINFSSSLRDMIQWAWVGTCLKKSPIKLLRSRQLFQSRVQQETTGLVGWQLVSSVQLEKCQTVRKQHVVRTYWRTKRPLRETAHNNRIISKTCHDNKSSFCRGSSRPFVIWKRLTNSFINVRILSGGFQEEDWQNSLWILSTRPHQFWRFFILLTMQWWRRGKQSKNSVW